MFDGDIRKERVARVMTLASQLTVQEMRAVVKQLTHLHDSIILEKDPMWAKQVHYGDTVYKNVEPVLAEDPNWEKGL